MEIKVYEKSEDADRAAAIEVVKLIKEKPKTLLGLATGETPIGLYEQLVQAYNQKMISFSEVITYNLDEYVDLDKSNPNSFSYFMNKHLFNFVDIPEEQRNIPNGCAPDLKEECQRYDTILKEAGQLDIQILSVGQNGHIGFNEPASSLKTNTHIVKLSDQTRKDNSKSFNSLLDVPTKAVTMGLGSIMKSKTIIFIAKGIKKAEIIKRIFSDDINTLCPGTFLQLHSQVKVYLDKEAASKLSDKTEISNISAKRY